jgi:putative transposase
MSTKLYKSSHCSYSLHLHIIFVTKYRRKVLTALIAERLREILNDLCEKSKSKLLEFTAEEDHCHLLVLLHPNNNISVFIKSLKSSSSRLLRKEFNQELSKTYWKPVLWSSSYCVISAGGAPLEVLKEYVRGQSSKT